MRAARLNVPGPLAEGGLILVEVHDPVPAPGEVLIDVAACAVCRTDLQIVEGDITAHHLPITPGHQVVGRIAAVGDGVEDRRPGDRVGLGWMAATCGICRFCSSKRENLCEQARFTGLDRDGGFAEKVTARADFTFPLGDDRSDVEVAPLLCGGVIGYRALRLSGIEPAGRLGLFGFGASALLTIQVALHWDCEVFVITRSAAERRRAVEMGAVWTGSYGEEVPAPLDAAITFAPVGEVVISALASVDRGGVVAINAIHLDRVPSFDYDLLWSERQIRSVANFTRADAVEFLRLASTIPIATVTDVYPLGHANDSLAAVRSGSVRGAAVIWN